jgi:hypothetical protein
MVIAAFSGAVGAVLAVIGSIGFYSFMFIHYSLPLSILSALVLASAYAVAFASRYVKEGQAGTPATPTS